MDLSDIRTRVYDTLEQEVGSSSLRWPQATIDELINDGNRDMAVRSGCLVETSTFTPVANQLTYDLPSDLVRILRFYRTDTEEKVWPVNPSHLDLSRPSWQSTSGNRLEWYFLLGLDQIVTGPYFTSVGSVAYKITYSQDPGETAMSADTDTPSVPRPFHESLVDYTVARALMIDAAGEELKAAMRFYGDYQGDGRRLRRWTFRHIDRRHILRPEDIQRADIGILPLDGGVVSR